MRLHNLPKTTTKSKKRVGRGIGSGKGKTCGRGTKGQKARYKVKIGFEGGQLRFLKRIPLLRGWNFPSHKEKPEALALERLNVFEDGTQVTPDLLVKKGLIKKLRPAGVKILNNGKLKKKLTLSGIQLSQSTQEQVEKLGGKVVK